MRCLQLLAVVGASPRPAAPIMLCPHPCCVQVNDSSTDGSNPPVVRTIDFVFDPDVDTADNLAAEISEEFSLSPTDTEICAAALREWLAKDMPGSDSNA